MEQTSAAAWSAAEYDAVRKDEVLGAVLAFLLGTFGAHQFYLGNNGLGILYAVFFWTGIPSICGFVEGFFMPGRVRAYNFARAQEIAQRTGAGPRTATEAAVTPPMPIGSRCGACGQLLDPAGAFCTRCGAPVQTRATA